MLRTKEQVKKLERDIDKLNTDGAQLAIEFSCLKRDISRVFMRVSRDFRVHSEKLDPDKEEE